jgi:hypothetical protein
VPKLPSCDAPWIERERMKTNADFDEVPQLIHVNFEPNGEHGRTGRHDVSERTLIPQIKCDHKQRLLAGWIGEGVKGLAGKGGCRNARRV